MGVVFGVRLPKMACTESALYLKFLGKCATILHKTFWSAFSPHYFSKPI